MRRSSQLCRGGAQAAPPAAPMPSPGGDAGNPLQRAPWRLQRQRQQQPQSVEEYIDRPPDLSDHKRSLLKQFPAFLSVIQAWIEVGKSMQ